MRVKVLISGDNIIFQPDPEGDVVPWERHQYEVGRAQAETERFKKIILMLREFVTLVEKERTPVLRDGTEEMTLLAVRARAIKDLLYGETK